MMQKIAYTLEDAAAQSNCSVNTLRQAVADGKLTARYANTTEVIRHEDLFAWVDQLPTKPNLVTSGGTDGLRAKPRRPATEPTIRHLELESDWLTPEDLSASLQLAPGTLANWRTNKKGPNFTRIGGLVRYRRNDVEAWIRAQPSE